MINEKELKEAVDRIKANPAFLVAYYHKDIEALLNLASQVMKIEGFPEKKKVIMEQGHITGIVGDPWKRIEQNQNEGFNEAITQCKLVVLKDYVKRSELPSREELEKIILNEVDFIEASNCHKGVDLAAQAIHDRITGGKK